MMMGSDPVIGMWVFMAVGVFIGVTVLVLAIVAVAMRVGAPAKRKRETHDTDADVYTFFDEKPKRGSKHILSDDGEILEVVDDDWEADEVAENHIDMARDAN